MATVVPAFAHGGGGHTSCADFGDTVSDLAGGFGPVFGDVISDIANGGASMTLLKMRMEFSVTKVGGRGALLLFLCE
jgi:hypothetical protein